MKCIVKTWTKVLPLRTNCLYSWRWSQNWNYYKYFNENAQRYPSLQLAILPPNSQLSLSEQERLRPVTRMSGSRAQAHQPCSKEERKGLQLLNPKVSGCKLRYRAKTAFFDHLIWSRSSHRNHSSYNAATRWNLDSTHLLRWYGPSHNRKAINEQNCPHCGLQRHSFLRILLFCASWCGAESRQQSALWLIYPLPTTRCLTYCYHHFTSLILVLVREAQMLWRFSVLPRSQLECPLPVGTRIPYVGCIALPPSLQLHSILHR